MSGIRKHAADWFLLWSGAAWETFKANASKRAEWPRQREMSAVDALARIASGEIAKREIQAFAAEACLRWQRGLPEAQQALKPFLPRDE